MIPLDLFSLPCYETLTAVSVVDYMVHQILSLYQKIIPTIKIYSYQTIQLITVTLTHQYSIRVHYCFQSMSNSKDSTMVELVTNHLLNYSIRSVHTLSYHKTVNFDNMFTYTRSTFAVASSITRILFFLNSALARHINCRWPTLKLEPLSDTSASNPLSKFVMTSFS